MLEEATPANLPRRLGRYDLVGIVANRRARAGSTVFVASARSASGLPPSKEQSAALSLSYSPLGPTEKTNTFQRPVAIELLSRELTRQPALVARFLEEARAVTNIRHANVVHIDEVGHSGDDVYLVMEYVMGESIASLLRHLQSSGDTLDFTLAAHIIAEASAGLEAAHGLGILHGRLTPHDVFIGYDGSVKVLDIGIAGARLRMEGGGPPRGLELQYASPERCRNEPLDRRSDVFSLGTMLWELNTGLSPFERAKERDTVRAICEEPIVSPGSVLRGLPEHVSRVTMQALTRDREKRYPNALALQSALLASIRRLGMGVPKEDLGRMMKRLFESRVEDKEEMLRRIVAGKSIEGLDIGDGNLELPAKEPSRPPSAPPVRGSKPPVSVGVVTNEPSVIIAPPSSPEIAVAPLSAPGPFSASPPTAPEADTGNGIVQPVARRDQAHDTVPDSVAMHPMRRIVGIGGAVIAMATIAVALLFAFRAREPGVVPTPAMQTSPPTLPPPTLPPPPPPPTQATPAPTPSAIEVPAPTASAPAVEEIIVHIDTGTVRAAVFVGGVKKGVAPFDLKLPRGRQALTVELRHPGYTTVKESVVPDENQRLKASLLPVRGPAGPTTGTASAPYHKFQ